MCVRLAVGHAGVAVAEHHDLVVPDDGGRLGELGGTDGADVGPHLGTVHGRVEDVALLAAGAADEHGADAFAAVLGDGARALRRLVVGMGVHGEEAERLIHVENGSGAPREPGHGVTLNLVDDPEVWRWIWLATAVVFLLGEMFAFGSFFLLPFAIGAAVAAILAFAGVGVGWEWLAFVVVSLGRWPASIPFVTASTEPDPPRASARGG